MNPTRRLLMGAGDAHCDQFSGCKPDLLSASTAMPPPDFWFDHVQPGSLVLHAPGIALVFSRDRGLAHALWVDSGSAAPAIGLESWLVRSGELPIRKSKKPRAGERTLTPSLAQSEREQ